MSHLYELTREMVALMDAEEVTETALQETFGAITEKADNICKLVAVIEGTAAMFKEEEQRLAARRKAMENRAQHIKDYLRLNMSQLGIDRIEAGTFTITLQNNPEKVEIDDENAIPQQFKTLVQTVTIDKSAIKAALKSGEVAGCRLVRGQHVRIR